MADTGARHLHREVLSKNVQLFVYFVLNKHLAYLLYTSGKAQVEVHSQYFRIRVTRI
jgi:hypothetical protein